MHPRTERASAVSIDEHNLRVRAWSEYREMPGLNLQEPARRDPRRPLYDKGAAHRPLDFRQRNG